MYANIYVTIQSNGLSAGAQTHYVTAIGVRNGLGCFLPGRPIELSAHVRTAVPVRLRGNQTNPLCVMIGRGDRDYYSRSRRRG